MCVALALHKIWSEGNWEKVVRLLIIDIVGIYEPIKLIIINNILKTAMGGCQSASEGIEVPKPTLPLENKFNKLEKHKLAIPEGLKAKL